MPNSSAFVPIGKKLAKTSMSDFPAKPRDVRMHGYTCSRLSELLMRVMPRVLSEIEIGFNQAGL